MPPKKELPVKEKSLFKRLIQEYETKKYKLGLKTADAILKKFPEAGETLCMKGLILATLERRDEGLELARRGVRCDIGSFLAWHALGIICRMDKNWDESVKCYSQALRIEGGTNINLMREISYLHMQQRNYAALIDVRMALLKLQPHMRINWIGLAVAHHAAGSLGEAIRVLESYESTLRDIPPSSYEHSETLLYHATILLEARRFDELQAFLADRKKGEIQDTKSTDLLLGRAQLETGQHEAAVQSFERLLKRNPEEKSYLEGWLQAKKIGLDAAGAEAAAAALTQLAEMHPRSSAVKRIALVYLSGAEFATRAAAYITSALQKGVPSIFADVVGLYVDDAKRVAIESLVEGLRIEWAPASSASTAQQEPTAYLWSLYFLAQHYSKLGSTSRALELIESAIAHTPTLPELHMTRARVLKRAGALRAAADAMEDARRLDGQDRFLNCKAAKYQLRIDDVEAASRVAGMFTKPDAADPVGDLLEMQAFWYLAEDAEAHARKGEYAMALKRLGQIDKTWQEIQDDQLDFHSYCVRKFTLRAYLSMLRFEDQLRSHAAYFRAAQTAITLLLRLHDTPALLKGGAGAANGQLTDEQRKELKKAKRAELRAAEDAKKHAAAKPKAPEVKKEDEDAPQPAVDEDPDGSKALAQLVPLKAAEAYLGVLQQRASQRVETWTATFDVALRSKNWLLCARAVAHAHALDSNDAKLHRQIITLKTSLPDLAAAPEPVQAGIKTALASVLPEDQTLEALHAAFVQRNATNAQHLLQAALALPALRGAPGTQEVLAALAQLAHPESKADLTTLRAAREELHRLGADKEALAAFEQKAGDKFPEADAFKSAERLEAERKEREEASKAWEAERDEKEEEGSEVKK